MQWKFTLILPALAIFLMSFNTKEVYFTINQKTDNKIQNQFVSDIIKIVIDKNTSDAELIEIKRKLRENGADFSYTVVHNTKNEIINIEVDVKSKYGNVTGVYDFKNSSNINLKIEIKIDNKIGEISIKKNSIENYASSSNQKSDNLNQWKVTSGRNNVAFATADTLYMYENKKSEFLPGVEEIIGSPLYILDNNESTKETIENLDSQKIESVAVLKGNSAVEKYGNKAKDGAIIVKTNNSKQIKQTVELSNLALHILNGREITKEMFEQIIPVDIESVNVLKSDSAIEKYGEKGKNEVIEIKTKATYRSKINFGGKGPLILLDGKEISKKEMENLNPNSVDRINVLKGKASRDKYRNKGKNGVIEITSKKE